MTKTIHRKSTQETVDAEIIRRVKKGKQRQREKQDHNSRKG